MCFRALSTVPLNSPNCVENVELICATLLLCNVRYCVLYIVGCPDPPEPVSLPQLAQIDLSVLRANKLLKLQPNTELNSTIVHRNALNQ